MKHVLKNERGMALAIAIVALVVVGALVAGALFSGTQEQRVAENVRRTQASFGVAEQGIYDII
ncbi:MAG TPA: PilX N-terminal domain-containing pilus assembly protein, partial [Gemmatimonadales bacterium]